MILTVTLNTSIDKLYLMTGIRPETVMRVKEVHNTAGGKGLNQSIALARAGVPVLNLLMFRPISFRFSVRSVEGQTLSGPLL